MNDRAKKINKIKQTNERLEYIRKQKFITFYSNCRFHPKIVNEKHVNEIADFVILFIRRFKGCVV